MNPVYPGLAAAAFYLIGAFVQINALARKSPVRRRRLLWITTPGVLLHALTAYLVLWQPSGINLGILSIASLIGFTLVLFVYIGSLWQPLENLFVMVLPLGALTVATSTLSSGSIIPSGEFGNGLLAHVLISILAYTVLAMAAGQSIILAFQEHSLRQRSTAIGFIRVLPPLQTMETLLFQLLWVGLIALTLSIGSGFLFLTDMFAQSVVYHTILASASWVIFAALLAGRYAFGWRSTVATRATLVGFTLLLFAYFGSKFVLEILLGRH
jgi:ABC-type uncharacterized transport system permease subunit